MVNKRHTGYAPLMHVLGTCCLLVGLITCIHAAEPPGYHFPNPSVSTNGSVRAVLFFNGRLYVGGNFTSVTGTDGTHSRTDIAAFDTATWEVTSFRANTNSGTVRAIAAAGGRVYAGGSFTRINGESCSKVAALDPVTGEVIEGFQKNRGTIDNSVWALAASDSALYIGGSFSTVDGYPRHYLAAVDPVDGTLDDQFIPDPEEPFDDTGKTAGGVYALEMHPDNPSVVFVGGNFQTVAGVTDRRFLVALNADGSLGPVFQDMDRNPVIDLDADSVFCFVAAGGWSNRVISYRIDGDPYTRQWRSQWVNGDVQAVAYARQGYVFFGCHDGVLDSLDDYRMAVLNANTGAIYDIYPTMNSFFGVRAMDITGDYLAVGGDFSRMNEVTQRYLAVFSEFPFTADGVLPPGVPLLSSPDDRMMQVELSVSLRWNFAAHAETYELEVATDPQFSDVVYSRSAITALRQRCGGLVNSTGYWWRVRAVNSAGTSDWSIPRYFITIPGRSDIPSLSAPSDGAVKQPLTVDLAWYPTITAQSYRVQLAEYSDFSFPIIDITDIDDTSYAVGGLTKTTAYYWRVLARTLGGESDWSTAWKFATRPDSNDIPLIACPEDGATGQPLSVQFCWHPVAAAQSYRLQLSTSRQFDLCTADRNGISDTVLSIENLMSSTVYFWRVNTQTVGGESEWSEIGTFTTLSGSADIPVLALPYNGATVQPSEVPLTWHPTGSALSYRVQCDDEESFTTPVADQNCDIDTFFTVGNLGSASTCFWRVSAMTVNGPSDWSTVWRFFTTPGEEDVPVIIHPADGTTDLPVSLQFRWRKVASAQVYGFQLERTDGDGTLLVNVTDVPDTCFSISGLENNTAYSWRVNALTAGGPSGWASAGFRTVVSAPGVPQCLVPLNDAVQCSLETTLEWRSVESAGSYTVQVSTDSLFSVLLYDTTGCTDTILDISGLSEDTRYYWRVGSVNAGGGTWSAVMGFRTRYPLPATPFLISPATGCIAIADTRRLVWNKSDPYVSKYRIEIATDSAMLAHLIDTVVTDTELISCSLDNKSTFWWRIRAYNESGWSDISETRVFSTRFPSPPPMVFSLDKIFSTRARLIVTTRVAERAVVQIELLDLAGNSAGVLLREERSPGTYREYFPVEKLSVGTYLLSFKAGGYSRTRYFTYTK